MAKGAGERWVEDSIAARRGIGWARKPALHELTEARQGRYHYTIGPYSDPVLHVAAGDRVRIETRDAFGGVIRSERDKPTRRLKMPFVNPQNGPI
ncbi:MAG: acetamidase/formamidase family protein, partial [Acetobacteraceae bacterium]